MAKFELKLPKMGESVAEATITSWLKEVGDTIEMDEPVLEIATDKVDSEVPSEVDGKLIENLSFKVAATSIPDWVKNTARQWSSDAVSKSDFINGIEHLIDTGIISAPVSDQDESHVPDWIKSTAKWWASDQISDNDFKKALEYLVKKGIIRV